MELIKKPIIAIMFGLAAGAKVSEKVKLIFDKAGYSRHFVHCLILVGLLFGIALFTKYPFYSMIGLLAITPGALLTWHNRKEKPAQHILSIVVPALQVARLWLHT